MLQPGNIASLTHELKALGKINRLSLGEQVAVILKRYISLEDLQEGDRLPSERELIEALGVSRRVVREALRTLAGEGIIVKQQGSGSFVSSLARNHLDEAPAVSPVDFDPERLIISRCAIEIGAMPVVTLRATPGDLECLREALAAQEQVLARQGVIAPYDAAFHRLLLKATHDETLRSFEALIVQAILMPNIYKFPGTLRRVVFDQTYVLREHRAIVDALTARDGSAAIAAMQKHLEPYYNPDSDHPVLSREQRTPV